MRLVFLIPDLSPGLTWWVRVWLRARRSASLEHARAALCTTDVFGGTLNLMRHCRLARSLGADAVLATRSGRDTYGARGIGGLPYVAWAERRPDDVCIIPDVYSHLADAVAGIAVVYEQSPLQLRSDFDHARDGLRLWACSPYMAELCRRNFPGKPITLVPPVVDMRAFPFQPPAQRDAGRLAALPRKNGLPFIRAVERCYHASGGRYWKLDLIDGVPFHQFAAWMRRPQALLAASAVEGCGLPGMEAMAAGMVVTGRDGGGASFYMEDGVNALVANTPEKAAAALRAIEDERLRNRLAYAARGSIQQFFPDAAPKRFWEAFLAEVAIA